MDGAVRLRSALALIVWAVGCEALVNGQVAELHCQAEGAVGPPACPDGYGCTAGLCVPASLGAPCNTDSDCAGGNFCLDPGVWNAPVAPDAGMPEAGALDAGGADASPHPVLVPPAAGQKRCSRTCCTSSDCDPDAQFVCELSPAAGGGFCRAAAEVQRGAVGSGKPMSPCSSPAECRSGLCADHHCVDTCCSDTSCAAGAQGVASCRFGAPVPTEPPGFWCAFPAGGKLPPYQTCKIGSECASGFCGPFGTGNSACLPPCCSSTDCPSDGSQDVQCVVVPPWENGMNGGGVRACGAPSDGTQGASNGIACSSPAECRGGQCIDHRCSDTCCSDASCGDEASLVCRPVNIEGGWPLRCEPK